MTGLADRGGFMRGLLGILSGLLSLYMLILVVRIILTWFRGSVKIPDFLAKITDPYLNWFKQFTFLRIGYLDLSPIAAIAVLSVFNQILSTLVRFGTISLGIILALVLQIIWSIVSFFIIFLLVVIILRLIAYLTNQNTYGNFWRIVDTISQPVLYRINHILFGGRIVNYMTGIIISVAILAIGYFILRLIYVFIFNILVRFPI